MTWKPGYDSYIVGQRCHSCCHGGYPRRVGCHHSGSESGAIIVSIHPARALWKTECDSRIGHHVTNLVRARITHYNIAVVSHNLSFFLKTVVGSFPR